LITYNVRAEIKWLRKRVFEVVIVIFIRLISHKILKPVNLPAVSVIDVSEKVEAVEAMLKLATKISEE